MERFPKWVPEEVIEYYEGVLKRETPSYNGEVKFLRHAMLSRDMERAWKAVARRGENVATVRFAKLITKINSSVGHLDEYPSLEKIQNTRDLSESVRRLQSSLHAQARITLNEWWEGRELEPDLSLGRFFRIPPLEALEGFAEWLESIALMMEETRTELTAYVGKPNARDAERVFVIRKLSEGVMRLYGQPLYETVAITSGEIIGETIGQDIVRKLVKSHKNLRPPYYIRPSEWQR